MSLLVIPKFIEAKSKKDLTRFMFIAQQRFRANLHFFDIQFAQGNWIAWYEIDIRKQPKDTSADK